MKLSTAGAGAYILKGKKTHFLELGADLAYLGVDEISDDQRSGAVTPDYPVQSIYGTLNLGYRAMLSKCIFKAGIAPGFIRGEFLKGAYIGIGFGF